MKLSLKKKLGHLQVVGGRILRTIEPHLVAGMRSAARGDLAVELVAVQTGLSIGAAYLSGRAQDEVLYNAVASRYFEEVRGVYADLNPSDADTAETLIARVAELRAWPAELVAITIDPHTANDASAALNFLATQWRPHQDGEPPVPFMVTLARSHDGSAHLIASSKPQGTPNAVGVFHAELLMTSTKLVAL